MTDTAIYLIAIATLLAALIGGACIGQALAHFRQAFTVATWRNATTVAQRSDTASIGHAYRMAAIRTHRDRNVERWERETSIAAIVNR